MDATQEIAERRLSTVLAEYDEKGFKRTNAVVSIGDAITAGSFWGDSVDNMRCSNIKEALQQLNMPIATKDGRKGRVVAVEGSAV